MAVVAQIVIQPPRHGDTIISLYLYLVSVLFQFEVVVFGRDEWKDEILFVTRNQAPGQLLGRTFIIGILPAGEQPQKQGCP